MWERFIVRYVRIIARRTLVDFWTRRDCRAAEQPLKAWFQEVEKAQWKTPADIRATFGSADLVANGRVIFNIGGNKFRLVVAVKFATEDKKANRQIQGIVWIKFVGMHKEYDAVDPSTVEVK